MNKRVKKMNTNETSGLENTIEDKPTRNTLGKELGKFFRNEFPTIGKRLDWENMPSKAKAAYYGIKTVFWGSVAYSGVKGFLSGYGIDYHLFPEFLSPIIVGMAKNSLYIRYADSDAVDKFHSQKELSEKFSDIEQRLTPYSSYAFNKGMNNWVGLSLLQQASWYAGHAIGQYMRN